MSLRVIAVCLSLTGLCLAHWSAQDKAHPDKHKAVSKYGTYGQDFFYYKSNKPDKSETLSGVRISRFFGRHNKTVDIAVAQPYITKLEFPAGHSQPFPSANSFWLNDDASYVVISGNATFGTNSSVHGYGDVFWVMAGWPHGTIQNVGDGPLVINVIGMDWQPQSGAMPSWYNPSVDWYLYTNRSYRRVDAEVTDGWAPNPSPHSDECMANGGVYNLNFAAISNTMPVLRVKWAANCSIPFHYHPTGAMYFILYGQMFYSGDFVDRDEQFNPSDSRWVRPGFAYGPEYNGDAAMEITVFGTDTPPEFSTPPAGPYKVQKTIPMTHIYEHQAGFVPHGSSVTEL